MESKQETTPLLKGWGGVIRGVAIVFILIMNIDSTFEIIRSLEVTAIGPAQVLLTMFLWFGLGVFINPKSDVRD